MSESSFDRAIEKIVIDAETTALAFTETLCAILAFGHESPVPASSADRSVPLVGRASTAAGALTALVQSLAAEREESSKEIVEARVDGVLRGDRGVTAWGYAMLSLQSARTKNPETTLVGDPVVIEERGGTRVEIQLSRLGGAQ